MKEILTILGKTTPNFDEDLKMPLLCTTGVNKKYEWRRLYPVSVELYDSVRNWSVVEFDLKPQGQRIPNSSHRDHRPETRFINTSNKNSIKILHRINSTREKFEILKRILCPSSEWIKQQRNPRRTIGIIKPVIEKVIIKKTTQEPKESKLKDFSSILDFIDPNMKEDEKKRRNYEKKLREYSTRILDVRFQFRCEFDSNCNGHNMQVLDDGLHQYIRNINKEISSLDELINKTRTLIEDAHEKSWIFLGLGTMNAYPFQHHTIGSVFRFPKSKFSKQDIDNLNPKNSLLQFM